MATAHTLPLAMGASPVFWNLPNLITITRLGLTIWLCLCLERQLFGTALVLLLVAAGTDWLDGYLARRWNQITIFGRVADSFVDKLLICGTFIYLTAYPQARLAPSVTALVVLREFLVTGLRSFFEQRGQDFSAKLLGKLKFVSQVAVGASGLARLCWSLSGVWDWLHQGLVWLCVVFTLISAGQYALHGLRLLAAPLPPRESGAASG